MKLPFVSRTAFEIALTNTEIAREETREARRALQDMTAKYHQLRLQGQTLPEPVIERPAPKATDPLVSAINERMAGYPELRAAALRQLATDRAAGKSDDDILRDIYEGMSVMDEGTPI